MLQCKCNVPQLNGPELCTACDTSQFEAKGLTWFTPGEDQSLISAAMLKAGKVLEAF